MAVKLRLRREGTVKRPHYRIVAADSRSPRDGRFIESLGHYHPLDEPSTIRLDAERALHWLRNGALPTAAVEKLLRIEGVWEQFRPGDAPARVRGEKQRLSKKARARAEAEAEAAAAPAPAEEPAEAPASEADDAPAADEAPAAEEPAAEAPAADEPASDEEQA